MRVLSVLVWSACTLPACGGSTGPAGQATTGNNTGPEVFTPAQVQAARAQCSRPDGPVQTFTTFGTVRTALSRSWLLCSVQGDGSGDTPTVSWATSSIELDASGQWVTLGLDAQGGLVHVYGVNNQGDWEIEDGSDTTDAGASAPISGGVSFILHFDSGGGNGGSVSFETGPMLMQWEPDYFISRYVALGP